MTYAEQLGPYLFGVYESELDEAWAAVLLGTYDHIVDIGAKFGYYAVGLARRYPDVAVTAFDTDWWARSAVREMANANGVRNIAVKGYCSPEWLMAKANGRCFIMSDCEGYEAALFGKKVIASLSLATLLIETHDCFVPEISNKLRTAFEETHRVEQFDEGRGRRTALVSLDSLSPRERSLALHEVRSPQTWLLCTPHESHSSLAR